METIHKVYGPHANIYSDVLHIDTHASQSEIREAFFCLRYDIYQKLSDDLASNNNSSSSKDPSNSNEGSNAVNDGSSNSNNNKKALTPKEREEIEERMDAITSAFRILTDVKKKGTYDASLKDHGNNNGGNDVNSSTLTDEMGFPTTANTANNATGVAEEDNNNASPKQSGFRNRSVFRRQRGPTTATATTAGGMNNASPRVAATPVVSEGGINPSVRAYSPNSIAAAAAASRKGRHSPNWAQFSDAVTTGPAANKSASATVAKPTGTTTTSTKPAKSAVPAITTSFSEEITDNEENDNDAAVDKYAANPHATKSKQDTSNSNDDMMTMPAGVNNLNMREQMLYKNQMFLHKEQQQLQQQQLNKGSRTSGGGTGAKEKNARGATITTAAAAASRVGSRYETDHRGDWLGDTTKSNGISKKSANSNNANSARNMASPKGVDEFDSSFKPLDKQSQQQQQHVQNRQASNVSDAETYDDDDTRTFDDTYDDDTTNYDDDTTNYDETTLGDSTWASEYDDGTSVGGESAGKYRPSHKSGNMPEPILKSKSSKKNALLNRQGSSSDRRVTIHAHRGRGEDDEYTGESMCPIPSFREINDEVMGTYTDLTSTFHQVLHAFVISPDDIDRMADKIRDAKSELAENYQHQVRVRAGGSIGGGGSRKKTIPIEKAFSS